MLSYIFRVNKSIFFRFKIQKFCNFLVIKLVLFTIFINPNISYSQCEIINTTFEAGEKLNFKVSYNWAFIWMDAAIINFSVDSMISNGTKVLHLSTNATSYPKYDYFFKVRDNFDSYVEYNTLKPILHIQNTSEGRMDKKNTYKFDYKSKKIYAQTASTEKPKIKIDTFAIKKCTYDLLTATYIARCIDFSKMKSGDLFPVTVCLDDGLYDLYIRYNGKKQIETPDGKKYNCLEMKALIVEGTIFNGGEDVTCWVSDDENKIPVLIEANVLVGTVKAYLINYKNLKYKFNANVK